MCTNEYFGRNIVFVDLLYLVDIYLVIGKERFRIDTFSGGDDLNFQILNVVIEFIGALLDIIGLFLPGPCLFRIICRRCIKSCIG